MNSNPQCANTAQIIQLYETWNRHDIPELLNHFHQECIFYDIKTNRRYCGLPKLEKYLHSTFTKTPDHHISLHRLFANAQVAFSEWTAAGMHAHTQTPFQVAGLSHLEMCDGKVLRVTQCWSQPSGARHARVAAR